MLDEDDTTARAHICHACSGDGYTIEPVCCGCATVCGTDGCTGAEAGAVPCESCGGKGWMA